MTNPIDRKTAEAARRTVLRIDALSDACGARQYEAAERAECVKVWNEFCAQETHRLEAKPLRINPMATLFGG